MSKNSPAGSATGFDLADLMTYPSQHGTLVRLADVKCALARATPQHPSAPAAAVRAAERIDAMHKGVVGVFAAIKAEHDAATPQHSVTEQTQADVIHMLLDVARCAYDVMDNSEERAGRDGEDAVYIIQGEDFAKLDDAMTKLEALPDDRPGYVMGPAAKAEWALAQPLASAAAPASTAASEQQAGAIERIADELDQEAQAYEGDFADVVRGCVESLRALSGRATIPSEADERALFDAYMKTPAPDDYDASVKDAWLIWQEAWRAALTHRATTGKCTGRDPAEGFCKDCRATTATPGYKLVPLVPTKEMYDAARLAWCVTPSFDVEAIYKAMLAATPDIATTAADQQGAAQRTCEERYGDAADQWCLHCSIERSDACIYQGAAQAQADSGGGSSGYGGGGRDFPHPPCIKRGTGQCGCGGGQCGLERAAMAAPATSNGGKA